MVLFVLVLFVTIIQFKGVVQQRLREGGNTHGYYRS